jgi:2-polyprenyl-6-methoxyphenol hydroxylase-like FAD-dependent oxidoreductase
MEKQNTDDALIGEQAIVVGAGMAGLMAAVVLSDHFSRVVIIERDTLPAEPALRKGVPQGGHVHTFLGYAVEAMEELLPGVMEELYYAGAVKIRRNHDIWFHDAAGPTPIRDVGILTPSVTRPLLEHVTRQRVMALSNIFVRDRARVLEFQAGDDGRLTGVSVKNSEGDLDVIPADLVVDCSGRGSRTPRWLEDQGYGAVPTQSLEIAMTYTSGLFRPPPRWRDSTWACLMLAIPPGLRAAYLTPVDGEVWLATMYARAGDTAPRDHQGFVDWTRGLAHPVIHERLEHAEPVSKLRSYNIPEGTWRRYDQMQRFPQGLIPMGEAFTSFNPMYGQGISLSAGQAISLRRALQGISGRGSGLETLAAPYFESCTELNAVGWSVMETRDLAYSSTKGPKPADLEERWRIGKGIRLLAEDDPHVHQMTVRVMHLLDHPRTLLTADILERAEQALASE